MGPLFKLLGKVFSDERGCGALTQDERRRQTSGVPQSMSTAMCYVQQTLLLILEDIFASFMNANTPLKVCAYCCGVENVV